jgi:hypothetical protein
MLYVFNALAGERYAQSAEFADIDAFTHVSKIFLIRIKISVGIAIRLKRI